MLTARRVAISVALAMLAAATVLIAGGQSWAGGAKPKVTTTTTFHLDDVEGGVLYHGRLKSDRHVCEAHRKIKIFASTDNLLVDAVSSKSDGRWESFQADDGYGIYKVVGLRKETPHVVCKRFKHLVPSG